MSRITAARLAVVLGAPMEPSQVSLAEAGRHSSDHGRKSVSDRGSAAGLAERQGGLCGGRLESPMGRARMAQSERPRPQNCLTKQLASDPRMHSWLPRPSPARRRDMRMCWVGRRRSATEQCSACCSPSSRRRSRLPRDLRARGSQVFFSEQKILTLPARRRPRSTIRRSGQGQEARQ
jgi:hypothetical protein